MEQGIFAAIDTNDLEKAKNLAQKISKYIFGLKLGMEFFYSHSSSGVVELISSLPQQPALFLDLKFHDIPNTVAGAVRAVSYLQPDFLTVHSLGGADMIRAAVEEVKSQSSNSKILAVTILTSMNEKNLISVGIKDDIKTEICRLAELSLKAGADGLVCSPLEIQIVRENFGKKFTLITPGIRPKNFNSNSDDQKRTLTAKQAIDLGANYLVVGRPITQAPCPQNAAKSLMQEIALA